jgi:hypothetical protein
MSVPFNQEFLTEDEIKAINSIQGKILDVPMTLTDKVTPELYNGGELPYRQSVYKYRFAHHYGQRKLLLAEVQFLSDYYNPDDDPLFVYAGAAPGISIALIKKLFPKLRMHLYDPASFIAEETDKIKIFTNDDGMFNDDTIAKFKGEHVLFMSDIRSGNSEDETFDLEVDENMKQQMRWCILLQKQGSFVAASLKFRLPYKKIARTYTTYLDGVIHAQCWAPLSSTEGRLCLSEIKTRRYDDQTYEYSCFFRNVILREWGTFRHDVLLKLVPGLDYCMDCASEICVWQNFLRKQSKIKVTKYNEKIANLMNAASAILHQQLVIHCIHPRITDKMYRMIADGDQKIFINVRNGLIHECGSIQQKKKPIYKSRTFSALKKKP